MKNDRNTAAEIAYRVIEEMIVKRTLPPGSMISEGQLKDDLKIGRTPVREALQRLKHEGYVEIHPRRGAQVLPIAIRPQLELLEVRRSIDDLAVTLAAKRATDLEREKLRGYADEIEEAAARQDRNRYLSANLAINKLRREATGNLVLASTLANIHGLSRRFWFSYLEDMNRFSEAATLQAAVARAIADGDESKARQRFTALLDFLETMTRSAIEQGPSRP
jgi:DNA-binding GntR family transcriptional regulator